MLGGVSRSIILLALPAIAVLAGCGSTAAPTTAPASTVPAATADRASPVSSAADASGPSPTASSTAAPSSLTGGSASPQPTAPRLIVTSSAFAAGKPIPSVHTCHGTDRSPALAWSGVPPDAKALVLFVDDPDGHDWVHWSVLDLAPTTAGLPVGVSPSTTDLQQGTNDFGNVGYGGPCPPSGTHHYRFTLSALAAPLGLPGHPGGAAVRSALKKAQVIDQVTLVGTSAA
jgi:Raf kinase inhibitor-like YbhB/YbcL family protein